MGCHSGVPKLQFKTSNIPVAWVDIFGASGQGSAIQGAGWIISADLLNALRGDDLRHVALSAAIPDPQPVVAVKEEVEEDQAVDPLEGKGQVFPYLQLTIPHCESCRCYGAKVAVYIPTWAPCRGRE